MKRLIVSVFALFLGGVSVSAEEIGTLTLDGLSFISFQDEESLLFPAGATIAFRFGSPNRDGSIPFRIEPTDVSIPPIEAPSLDGQKLTYSLSAPASGVMRTTPSGRRIEFQGSVSATLRSADRAGAPFVYPISFTTEAAEATSQLAKRTVKVTGMRLVEGALYAQIVGATVNKEDAFPKPGTAVYTVLSGTFDQLPSLPDLR